MQSRFPKLLTAAAIVSAALAITACNEIPQDADKSFAGKDETRSYAGHKFNGDQAMYEKALADRAQTQNEYLVTGNGKKQARP